MSPRDLRRVPRPADRDRLDVRDLVADAATGAQACSESTARRLGERPVWDARSSALVWVDIDGRAVHRWADGDPARDTVLSTTSPVGVAWPTSSGGLLLATADGLAVHDGTRLGPLTRPEDMPDDYRFNDGGCDPAGRFWVSTLPRSGSAGDGVVLRVVGGPGGLEVDTALTGVALGNGIAWSPDGSVLYLTDTDAKVVHRLPYDVAAGTAGEPEPFLAFRPDGPGPDGTAVDAEGGLWIATYGGGHVLRFAADGTPRGAYAVPVPDVTCPGFGPAGSGALYVTTASSGGSWTGGDALPGPASAEEERGGAVFRVDVDVDGSPVREFADG
ncbi:SMP-30/gluconolactonase/LRE family protein [Cellulomonas sp. Marseille-Q8402]